MEGNMIIDALEGVERFEFNRQLCDAIRLLHYKNYFSYLKNCHRTQYWGLIDHDYQITPKGILFVEGWISIPRMIVVTPNRLSLFPENFQFPDGSDPEILRGDSFVYIYDFEDY
jgi:hypothetical protein